MTADMTIGGSVDTEGGDIAGRDVFNIVLQVIQKSCPINDPLPKQFKTTIDNLGAFINLLRAWKEVHNTLDEIRNRFDPFKYILDLTRFQQRSIRYYEVRNPWRLVANKFDNLSSMLNEIEELEVSTLQEFRLPERSRDANEAIRKARQLINLSNHMNTHLNLDAEEASPMLELSLYQRFAANIRWKIGVLDDWWQILFDWTDDLDSKLTESMYLADKALRLTAEILFEYSRSILGEDQQNE